MKLPLEIGVIRNPVHGDQLSVSDKRTVSSLTASDFHIGGGNTYSWVLHRTCAQLMVGYGAPVTRGTMVFCWRWFKVASVAAWLLLIGTLQSHAVTIERAVATGRATVLVIKGEFVQADDPAQLVEAAKASAATTLTFDSPGGNVVAAMRYGRMIRTLGLNTVQARSSECASACALAFVGGVQRNAEAGSIGVHRSSFSGDSQMDSQLAVAAVQSMTAEIITYLVDMGVSPQLLQLSLAVDSSDMRYLTSSEMTQFHMIGSSAKSVSSDAVAPTTASSPQIATSTGANSQTEGDEASSTAMTDGWWVIVGIMPGQSFDDVAAAKIHARIQRCGMKAFNDFSGKFAGFAPGFTVFVLGAYSSKGEANSVLAGAERCVPDAYIKRGRYLGE